MPRKKKKESKPKEKDHRKDLDFEKDLWKAADKLRGNVDPGIYKHIVLGLIFLKYVSDSFAQRREQLEEWSKDPKNKEYYMPSEKARKAIIEGKEQYKSHGIFYVPIKARWQYLQSNASQSNISHLIDKAMELIENGNSKDLKGVLPKDYTRTHIDNRVLGELIGVLSKIKFDHNYDKEKDILGRVYEYFLSQFASAEGKRGGQFYTPRSIVKLLVEVLEPFENARVFDPACGSGGMFVQSREFLKIHHKNPSKIAISGQESNPTTWRLCKMNLAIRGISGNIQLGDSYHNDKFPDLRADFVIANPPFNMSEWGSDRINEKDPRIKFGLPPEGNANFMWIQHFLYHLAPNGLAGFVMANGALAVGGREGEIRKKIIEKDAVEVIIACPPKLFYSVALPVSLWFLAKNKKNGRFKNRAGQTLFIDARELFEHISRKQVVFKDEHIQKMADTVRAWRGEKGAGKYKDIPGFCKSASLEEIAKNGYVLTPGRYVGVAPLPPGPPFKEEMKRLSKELKGYFGEGKRIEKEILKNLDGLGF